ncbi:glycine--tRNA ligase subunit beta [Maricaulaceae bacterium EIL42A08]|nr:glycine--tRNA ligase subunit beta [Maricaulaceae bacterium EIL42A08]
MSELLLEFFCEEIPARMQARAEADLEKLFVERLKGAGLNWDALKTFSGPRRLGLVITGLPTKTEDVREERKGPKVGAPDKAIEGFLRSAGLDSLDQCKIEDGKKGQFYIALIEKPGRATADVVAEAVPDVAKTFPWPKSMKFGEDARQQRWVRPLQRILCLMDGQVVDTEVFGIKASNITEGHRVHGDGPFEVSDFASYEAGLRDNGVILNRAERRELILTGARKVCTEAGFELVEDSSLLEEVTGLVEHPVPVLGEMDPEFLDLPPEVITLTMKTHQKYFAVQDKTGKLVSKFVVIANQDAPDGGVAIAAGNARVLSARLSDARHFWDLDRKTGLEAMAAELSKVTFHEKLGTVADKTERVATLARELADAVGADPELAYTAAKLAKADLVSQMVYEFPELQGAMGRYYALEAGLDAQTADAIRDHYKPQGPSDAVPTAPVSAAVALADKLDTLVGFWAINEKPTGSKDPFALRRAALGVIRVLLEGNLRLPLNERIVWASKHLTNTFVKSYLQGLKGTRLTDVEPDQDVSALIQNAQIDIQNMKVSGAENATEFFEPFYDKCADLLAFFADRLKVHLKDEGIKHDVIDAVFALGDDDLVRVTNKARALQAFLDAESGTALLAGYRRAANILAAEEKKGFDLSAAREEVGEASLLSTIRASATASEETALIDAIEAAETAAQAALAEENFEAAMKALAQLRGPVDAFFEAVVVNDEDAIVRRNRLLLLSRIRAATDAVADFSRLEG